MKPRLVKALYLGACFALLLAASGCHRHDSGPPPPLPVEEMPLDLQQAFSNAGPEAKEAVNRMTAALQNTDYPAAYEEAEILCGLPDETSQQRQMAARALLTLTKLLQSAQAQGDQKAAAALKLRQMTR